MPSSDPNDLEAWIPIKAGIQAVLRLNRPELWRAVTNDEARRGAFTDDPPGSWLGDETEVPLWLYTLARALATAVYVPPFLDLAEAVRLVESDPERRDGMAVMARLGVFHSSSVILQLLEWRENG
jgi:hypothetical protein